MNRCNGWKKYAHDTTKELTEITFKACEFCGGNECGSYADTIYLCLECLKDYKRKPIVKEE